MKAERGKLDIFSNTLSNTGVINHVTKVYTLYMSNLYFFICVNVAHD